MSTVGRGMHVFKQAIALILARVRSKSPAIYQELPLPPYLDLEERTPSRLWARCSLYYWISFLSNVLLVICSLSGYIISGDRDSDQATNCSRFTIVGVYALPTVVATGFLISAFGKGTMGHRYNENYKMNTHLHTKLAVFCTVNSALSFIFMDIYALGLDNPDTRFGTRDDVRNWLLGIIMCSSAVSFLSLLISLIITFFAAARRCQHLSSRTTETMQSLNHAQAERGGPPTILKQAGSDL